MYYVFQNSCLLVRSIFSFRHATLKLKGNENYDNGDIISIESCRMMNELQSVAHMMEHGLLRVTHSTRVSATIKLIRCQIVGLRPELVYAQSISAIQ